MNHEEEKGLSLAQRRRLEQEGKEKEAFLTSMNAIKERILKELPKKEAIKNERQDPLIELEPLKNFGEKERAFFVLDAKRLAIALDYFFLSHLMRKKEASELQEITAIFYNGLRSEVVAAEVYEGLYQASRFFEGFFNLNSFRRFLVKEVRLRYVDFYHRSTNPHTGETGYVLREDLCKKYGLGNEEGMKEFLKTVGVSFAKDVKKTYRSRLEGDQISSLKVELRGD